MQTLIIGIGNTLLSDDGAGIYALNFLRNFHFDVPDTKFVDGEVLEPDLTAEIVPTDKLIVIDVADLNAQPGSVHTFIDTDMDGYINDPAKNDSQIKKLANLIKEVQQQNTLPQRRALIGIQPLYRNQGRHLSAEVADAIPAVCCQVLNLIEEWH